MTQIDRIKAMEVRLDRALETTKKLDEAIECFRKVVPEINELIAYYEAEDWRNDFEADSAGKLPADLKRGVLSEDGIYNLLTDYERLKNLLTD